MKTLRERTLDILVGGVWHTTSQNLYERIVETGGIAPEPDIPNAERFRTGGGQQYYPYARSIGAVSVFDFRDFDLTEYEALYPGHSLFYFLPCRLTLDSAIWIEIDTHAAAKQLISGPDLLRRWKSDKAHARAIMGHVEGAHIGVIPTSAFRRCFRVKSGAEAIEWITS